MIISHLLRFLATLKHLKELGRRNIQDIHMSIEEIAVQILKGARNVEANQSGPLLQPRIYIGMIAIIFLFALANSILGGMEDIIAWAILGMLWLAASAPECWNKRRRKSGS